MIIIKSLILLPFAQASLYAEPPSAENTLKQKKDGRWRLCEHPGTYVCATWNSADINPLTPSDNTFHVDCHYNAWKLECEPKISSHELFINNCVGVLNQEGGLTNVVVPYTTSSNSYDCNSMCVKESYCNP